MALSNRGQHLPETDRAFVTKPIDIEGWCAIYPAGEAPRTIALDALGVHTIRELSRDPLCIEPQASRVAQQTGIIERVLVREHCVVHFPEHALRSRGLGNLCGILPVRVDLPHGEVAERKAQLVPERFSQCRDDGLCRAAIRAFEIAVLHE
jgi:hypothetical protein